MPPKHPNRDVLDPKHPRPQPEPRADRPADEDWGPDSNVEAPAYPAASPPKQSTSARAAFRKIDELGKKFDEHSKADGIALGRIHEKLEEQDAVLTEIQITSARTETSVNFMTEELRHKREIQKIRVEGEITTGVETQRTERVRMDGRTKVWLAIIAVVSTAVGAIAKWLVG